MKNYKVTLSVSAHGVRHTFDFDAPLEHELCSVNIERTGERLLVTLVPRCELVIDEAYISGEWACGREDTILLNGYQTWTLTRELTVHDKMRGIDHLPKSLINHYGIDRYGDYYFIDYPNKKGQLHGFSYGYIRRGEQIDFIGSLNERTGYTVLRLDARRQTVRIEKDCAGLRVSEPYELFDLALLHGGDDEVFDRWFELMGIDKPQTKPLCGYTSWYNHYQNINARIIDRDLEGMSALPSPPDIFQIDDGYQTAVGDWLSIDEQKFPDGLEPVVEKIHRSGMLAGLWLAPLVCETKSRIYREHKDWLLRDSNGEPIYCGCNWSGFWALDAENPEVREYLRKVFDTVLGTYGFDFVKLDFLYAGSFVGDERKSRAQRMCEAMDLLRELVGDKLMLGCGVPLWPAFGKADYCRIGCDVSLDWNDRLYMRLVNRERVSTKHAICNTVFRRQLDGRAFLNDPDVFLLRYENVRLSPKRKRWLGSVNGLFGSVLFMSDNAALYDERQRQSYLDILALRSAQVRSVRSHRRRIEINYTLDGREHSLDIRL